MLITISKDSVCKSWIEKTLETLGVSRSKSERQIEHSAHEKVEKTIVFEAEPLELCGDINRSLR